VPKFALSWPHSSHGTSRATSPLMEAMRALALVVALLSVHFVTNFPAKSPSAHPRNASRLFPDSPYAKEHSTEAPKKPAKD
jgi:flagellar motor protein MotB